MDDEKKDQPSGEQLRELAARSLDKEAAKEAVAAARSRKRRPPFERRELFEALLKQSDTVRLLVDGAAYGVVLPNELQAPKLVALHYGNNIPQPPKDLAVDEWGVRATLLFPNGEHLAAVPWDAVIQVSDMEHFLWQDSRRLKEFSDAEERERASLPSKHTKAGKAARRRLKLVQ